MKAKNVFKRQQGLTVIIVAALLVELLSAAQYLFTRSLMGDQLEKRAEMELTTKAIITKGIINNSERSLKGHIMEVKHNLTNPDSMVNIMAWSLKYAPHMKGCGIAFRPDYYENRDSLFEPYALRTDSGIQCLQVAGERFDYTKDGFYRYILEKKTNSWIGPYDDGYLKTRLISYAVPIYDFRRDTIAVYGLDIDTKYLGDTLNFRHIYPSSFDFLLTEDGKLIAGPSDPVQQKKMEEVIRIINDSTVKKTWSKAGRIRTTSFYDKDADDRLSVFFANIKGAPHWQVAVVCYDDEVYGSLMKLRFRLLLLSVLAFSILLFIIFRFARNEEKLKQKTMKEERIAGELKVANRIQQSMLPEQHMLHNEVEIYGSLVPAREVGGDLFDYFIRDEKLFFCIGDVSGKGAPSAMLMAVTHALFRSASSHESNPARIMQSINDTICQGNDSNMFVTLFIGILDLPTGHLRYCNAGHDVPFIIENESLRMESCEAHLPIGVFEDFKYRMQEMKLKPESIIFLYTDGLTEAKKAPKQMFGIKRTEEILVKCAEEQLRPKPMLEKVTEEVHNFVGNAEQSDDLTMLAIRYTPRRFESTLMESLELKNNIKEVTRLNSFIKMVAEKIGLDKSLARQLQLAVEEAVVNIMDYAYPAGTEGNIELRIMSDGKQLKVVIIDSGVPFDPTSKEKADTTLSAEERQIGGLGLLLVRELMDSINYERTDGKNILTLIKTISKITKHENNN